MFAHAHIGVGRFLDAERVKIQPTVIMAQSREYQMLSGGVGYRVLAFKRVCSLGVGDHINHQNVTILPQNRRISTG